MISFLKVQKLNKKNQSLQYDLTILFRMFNLDEFEIALFTDILAGQ